MLRKALIVISLTLMTGMLFLYDSAYTHSGHPDANVLPPKFGPLPKPRLWYNIHDLKGGPNGETKTQKLHP